MSSPSLFGRQNAVRLWSCNCFRVLVLVFIVAVDGTRVRAAEYTLPSFLDQESVHSEEEDGVKPVLLFLPHPFLGVQLIDFCNHTNHAEDVDDAEDGPEE